MSELLHNRHLWAALTALAAAQVLKLLFVYLEQRRLRWERLLETGGMPSSHTAFVTALAVGIGLTEGLRSPTFAVSAVMASIVFYDATGIRRAAGMQAAVLNDLVHELQHLFDEGFVPQRLKTLLGHTYPQVLAGTLLGLATALLFFL